MITVHWSILVLNILTFTIILLTISALVNVRRIRLLEQLYIDSISEDHIDYEIELIASQMKESDRLELAEPTLFTRNADFINKLNALCEEMNLSYSIEGNSISQLVNLIIIKHGTAETQDDSAS